MPVYNFAAYDINDFTGAVSNATQTVGATAENTSTTFTESAGVQIFIDDDDLIFNDAYIENQSGTFNQTLAADLTVGGQTFLAGRGVELEYSVTSTTGVTFFVVRIGNDPPLSNSGDNVLIITSEPLVDGTTYVFPDNSSQDGAQTPYNVICFGKGTMIETAVGDVAVEKIQVGDLVPTKSGRLAPVIWIGSRKISKFELTRQRHLQPIKISKGTFGKNTPSDDLIVSPQHRIYQNDWRAELLFAEPEYLVPAIGMINDSSVQRVVPEDGVEYFHILFDQHEVIKSNGQWSESFYPGEQGMSHIDQAAHDELMEIFPELEHGKLPEYEMSYPCLKPKEYHLLNA